MQLTQPLFEGFQNLNAIRQAKSTVQAAREALRTVEQTVLLDAATAYVNVVRDTAIVRLRENDVTRADGATQGDQGPLRCRRGDTHRRGAG